MKYILPVPVLTVIFSSLFVDGENETSSILSKETDFLFGSRSKKYFNAIDKAHELLKDSKNLVNVVPSFVVVGMQSVGKSAVLSRISGIPFPQDSEVCTRVPMELRLRRGKFGDKDKPMIIKAGNAEGIHVDKEDHLNIKKILNKAQHDVLNGAEFEDKLSVTIEKEDPNLPEVTLIDLPGVFFAKTADKVAMEDRVKLMINERVSSDMALILHVVPLNQDLDTISTWRIVHDADKTQSRTISVLTKADLVVKDGKNVLKKRIEKIISDSKSSACFVIHGAAKDLASEEEELAVVSDYIAELHLDNRVMVGVKELNSYIEERMLEHIKDKLPKMRLKLEEELRLCQEEIMIMRRIPDTPTAIAVRDMKCLTARLDKQFKSSHPDLRRLVERMSNDVFDVPTIERNEIESDAQYIQEFESEHRSLINREFTDKRIELQKFLSDFSNEFGQILRKFIDDLFDVFRNNVLMPAFKNCGHPSAMDAIKDVEAGLLRNVVPGAYTSALEYKTRLVSSLKSNMFTPNMKSFNEYSAECASSQNEIKEPYRTHVCDILGFIRVRRDVLPDSVQLHAIGLMTSLLERNKEYIEENMITEKAIKLIQEPKKITLKRESLLHYERQIEEALNEISSL